MKIGRISHDSPDGAQARLVAVEPEANRVVDLAAAERLRLQTRGATPRAAARLAAAAFPGSLTQALEAGPDLVEAAARAVETHGDDASAPLDAQQWLPAADPPVLRDCIAFVAHMQNYYDKIGHELSPFHYRQPGYFKAATGRIFGHGATIPWPSYTKFIDYELEIGFVVGQTGQVGHDLTPEEARAHIFGITVFNDYSARDYQKDEMQIGMGPTKSKDFAYGLGPWVTTVDEFDDLSELQMSARVNGVEWSAGTSEGMQWLPEELLAYISLGDRLQPGDVFGSGTVGGGSTLELEDGQRLKPGDVLELAIGGVGVLRSVMGTPEPSRWMPEPRKRPEPAAA